MGFGTGKLPLDVLERLLRRNHITDSRVIVGPGIGEDAAVIDTGNSKYLVAKTDPISFAIDRIGWYAVNVNANDIATMGGTPRWFLATLLLPEKTTDETQVQRILDDILESCRSLGIELIGGHTEITHGLNRPIVVGHMLGEVPREKLLRTGGSREGDLIILTKGIALEGTAVLARERSQHLANVLDPEMLRRAQEFIYDPGISVVKEASVVAAIEGIHAMHDPTEGGLASGLHELALAGRKGLVIQQDAINVFAETCAVCNHYGLNPLGLIASGALLIVCHPATADRVEAQLEAEGINSRVIGEVVSEDCGVQLNSPGGLQSLPMFSRDEITKVLE